MQEHITDDALRKIASEVEREYGMGGLTDGIYEDFALDVAKRAAAAVAQAVARECADVVDSADTPDGWSNSHISDAIRARFGITE